MVYKLAKKISGYTKGTGKGFGCIRCIAHKNNLCYYMSPYNNKILLNGGCCNIWTINTKGTEYLYGRLNKHQMGYIETTPGQKIECKECMYWLNGKCSVVEGTISPTASCNLWISRTKPTKQF